MFTVSVNIFGPLLKICELPNSQKQLFLVIQEINRGMKELFLSKLQAALQNFALQQMFCSVILLQNKCSVSSFMILRVAAFENLKIIQVPVKGPDHQKYLRQSTFPWKCKLLICSFIAKVVLKGFFYQFFTET